jgi:cytidine deaminase
MKATEAMIAAAMEARTRAYAPYSRFTVGAALLGPGGEMFTGCNVENASYGLTMCAERVAIGCMLAAGVRQWEELAVATEDGSTPCGACRQVLSELASESGGRVLCVNAAGAVREYSMEELLPFGFRIQGDARNRDEADASE